MRGQDGFTIVETLLSLVLMGTMMGTLLSSYTISERSFFSSETYLIADQNLRSAMEAVRKDLGDSQIVNYYDLIGADGAGNGKVFVKFRRLDPAAAVPVDANGDPAWEATVRAYLWCPTGAGFGMCNPAIIGFTPTTTQLLLLSSTAANPTGAYNLPWTVDRVVTNNLQSQGNLLGQDLNDDANGGFRVQVFRTDGAQLIQADEGANPLAETLRPFGAASALVTDWPRTQWPARVIVTIRTRANNLRGQPIRAQSASQVKLRDYQGDCGGPCPVNM